MIPTPARWSLRVRLTAAAVLVAIVGLMLAAVLMTALLQRALLGSLDQSARSDAADIAALVDAGRLTDPLPTFGAAVAQVIAADGTVRASSPGGDRLTPIVAADDLAAVRDGAAVDIDGARLGEPDPFRVVGVEAGPPNDPQTVLVAVSRSEEQRGGELIRVGTFIGVPVLTMAMAVISWYGVGRALHPVEALRQDASAISGTVGGRRLAVPPVDDEISRLASTLNAMLARIESATHSQRMFVADAAHELRSPLAALRAELEVWQAHPDRVDVEESVRAALAEADRMQRLVTDLLALARLDDAEADGSSGRRRTVRLDDLAAAVAAQYADSPGAGAITVTFSGPAMQNAPVEVYGDPDALARAISNLLDNALRHARSNVAVAVGSAGQAATLAVADDGAGIAESDRERIFDRFARLDDARARDDGGTGLGLAIVKATVEAHGGQVTVTDALPGARFVITLDRAGT